MLSNIKISTLLPNEIKFFKDHYIKEVDPIRREVFSYSMASYIIHNIVPFPVNIEYYYRSYYEYETDIKFIEFLALSYIKHRLQYNNKDTNKAHIKIEDVFYVANFISTFFESNLPIRDNGENELVWIYPKLNIKDFISNSFFENNYNNYFFEESTLIKLIMIIAGFSRYEISNIDIETNMNFKQMNYPTLILANIGLYEKGIIKVMDDESSISISLDVNAKAGKERIFSYNEEILKKTILKVINETESLDYSIDDFF